MKGHGRRPGAACVPLRARLRRPGGGPAGRHPPAVRGPDRGVARRRRDTAGHAGRRPGLWPGRRDARGSRAGGAHGGGGRGGRRRPPARARPPPGAGGGPAQRVVRAGRRDPLATGRTRGRRRRPVHPHPPARPGRPGGPAGGSGPPRRGGGLRRRRPDQPRGPAGGAAADRVQPVDGRDLPASGAPGRHGPAPGRGVHGRRAPGRRPHLGRAGRAGRRRRRLVDRRRGRHEPAAGDGAQRRRDGGGGRRGHLRAARARGGGRARCGAAQPARRRSGGAHARQRSGLTGRDPRGQHDPRSTAASRGVPMSVHVPVLQGRGMTMSDQLARWARTTPDQNAVRFDGAGRSYAELDGRVTRLARALADRGVGTGDRIAVLGLNGIEVWESYLAGVRLGAIVVPVNFRLVADEVAYVLTDSGATALVVGAPLAPVAAKAREQAPDVRTVLVIGEASAGSGSESFEGALAAASAEPLQLAVDEESPAFIMYTSGTTGRPKGAVLTHHNLLMHVFSQVVHLGWTPEDRVMAPGAPLFHIAGLAGGLPPLLLGGTNVIMKSGGFDPVETLDLIERERINSIFLVPAMWAAVVAVPDIASRDLSALHRLSWGAAPASTTLLRAMIDTFPQAEVVTAFGQTECSPVTCLLRGEDSIRKIGSVGTPMLNVEVRVVDELMDDVPQGEVGEIVYRSPMVMREYWNKPEATAEAFAGGWFHSGDLVREDEDGYYYVVDRKKDMIISGGENIYCAEVEDVLAAHPKVGEVALIGVPDERYGEAPLAVVAPRDAGDPPTPEELAAWCRERLARYKNPREYSIVGALPRNPSGKVLKTRLRDEHSAGSLVTDPVV